MARTAVELAEKALEDDDPIKAAATYELLVELWPDLPEARTGGAWRSAAARARRLSTYSRQLEAQRRQGLALKDRLAETSDTLESIHSTLTPLVESPGAAAVPPALDATPRAVLGSAVHGRVAGAPR